MPISELKLIETKTIKTYTIKDFRGTIIHESIEGVWFEAWHAESPNGIINTIRTSTFQKLYDNLKAVGLLED